MRYVLPALVLAGVTARGDAQPSNLRPDSVLADSVTHSTRVQRPAFGRNTRVMMVGSAIAGGAIGFFDSRISLGVQRMGGDDMSIPSAIGSFVGGPAPLALGATLYAAGRGMGHSVATHAGREVIRAVLVSGAITAVTKGAVGRARPFVSPGDPDAFSPGHGFTNATLASFPSGHTSAAFATATVLARELHANHIGARWWLDPLLFGGATFVGYSRIYQKQHWPSDVVAGAALGAITGYEVVAHAHGDRSPILGRLFSHVSVAPSPGGAAVAWSAR